LAGEKFWVAKFFVGKIAGNIYKYG
jgi:hypothetical protein